MELCAMALWLLAGAQLDALTREVGRSGRVVEIAEPASQRVETQPRQAAPGAPPLFSFRLFEGKTRHRYGSLDLVIDDAGH